MRRLLLLVLIVFAAFLSLRGELPSLDFSQAVSILTNTKPIVAPQVALGAVDPEKRKAAEALYEQQIAAISAIGLAAKENTADVLIPYLDYSVKGTSFDFWGGPPKAEDVNQTLHDWPALAALCKIPNSATALKNYALNRQNPLDYRVAAFHALHYIDINDCKMVGDELKTELGDKPHVIQYIQAIEDGKAPYRGVTSIKIL